MNNFLKTHEDWVLTAIALLIAGIIVGFLVWGVMLTSKYLGDSIDANNAKSNSIQFNLEAAEKLNFRGLK